ncbi:MAG: sortase, partial [Dehalococcoidia bacterium]|nr:sortase [Dehalococcoidia bacterium]
MRRRSGTFGPLLVALVALLTVACVRVEVQRTSTAVPDESAKARVQADEPAHPTPLVPATRRSSAVADPSRTLFRLRMPPARAIAIARLGIEVPVVEVTSVKDERGWHWPIPHDAAAHLAGTANPGEPGN